MDALILDFDGTLLDSYPRAVEQLNTLATRNGLAMTHEAKQRMLERWGHTGVEFLQYVFGIDGERAKCVYRDWEAMDTENPIPLIEGTHRALNCFHERGYTVCMLTSRHSKTV